MDDSYLQPFQREFAERLAKGDLTRIVIARPLNIGKTMAMMRARMELAMAEIREAKPSPFMIFDEFDFASSFEPLPPRVKDWKDQKPPEQVEQKKRPGVVLMRDRTGKLVERKL